MQITANYYKISLPISSNKHETSLVQPMILDIKDVMCAMRTAEILLPDPIVSHSANACRTRVFNMYIDWER